MQISKTRNQDVSDRGSLATRLSLPMNFPENVAWSVFSASVARFGDVLSCRIITLLVKPPWFEEKKLSSKSRCGFVVVFSANKNGSKVWSQINLHYKLTLELLKVCYAIWEFSAPIFRSYVNLDVQIWNMNWSFLISNFRRVLNVVCFILGNSLASKLYMPKFRNTLSVPSS